jgi:predicted enzyme related to lactoylglutathione lyase
MRLELVLVPVSDVDLAKAFYADQVGFVVDHDHQVNEGLRFVQLTPPGSACSIAMGTGITDAEPGSLKALQLVVADIAVAHTHLKEHGVEVTDIEVMPWGSFVFFTDPDGSGWSVQQLPSPSAPAG